MAHPRQVPYARLVEDLWASGTPCRICAVTGDHGVKVGDLFETLEYGPAPESASVANAWMDDHKREFGHFINNKD